MKKYKFQIFAPKNILIFLIFLTYFFSRLINLTAIPVFADEAIYIRWSQIMRAVETLRFLPLTDGKQPLFMWLTIPLLKIFHDPLFAGRFLSVLSGFISILGIYLLSNLFFAYPKQNENPLVTLINAFKPSIYSLFSSLIYLLITFTFFFDRLATPDSLLSALLIICTSLFLLQFKYERFDLSIILGVFYGLAWITKSPAIYHFLLLFTIKIFSKPSFKSITLFGISGIVMYSIYSILRLGPQFHMINLRNQDYVWPLTEILKHPLDPLKPHLNALISIYQSYLGFILFGLLAILVPKFRSKKIIIPFLLWIIPSLGVISTAKIFTSRYVLFTLPYLIILLSWFWSKLYQSQKILFLPIFIFISIFQIKNMYQLVTKPFNFNLPQNDRGYLQDWTSGWGIDKVSQYLIAQSRSGKNVIVATEGSFGTLPDGLQIYTNNEPRLTIVGLGIGQTSIPESLKKAIAFGDAVYILLNQSRMSSMPQELKALNPILTFSKPGDDSLRLYQLH